MSGRSQARLHPRPDAGKSHRPAPTLPTRGPCSGTRGQWKRLLPGEQAPGGPGKGWGPEGGCGAAEWLLRESGNPRQRHSVSGAHGDGRGGGAWRRRPQACPACSAPTEAFPVTTSWTRGSRGAMRRRSLLPGSSLHPSWDSAPPTLTPSALSLPAANPTPSARHLALPCRRPPGTFS